MKRSYKRVFMLACAVMSALFIASIASAQFAPPKSAPGWSKQDWWKNPRIIKELEITPEQQNELKALSLSKRKEIIKLNSEKKIKRIELIEEMDKTRPDLKKVKGLVSSFNEIRGKILMSVIEGMIEGMNILSEEQVEGLKEIRTQIRSQRQQQIRRRMQRMQNQ